VRVGVVHAVPKQLETVDPNQRLEGAGQVQLSPPRNVVILPERAPSNEPTDRRPDLLDAVPNVGVQVQHFQPGRGQRLDEARVPLHHAEHGEVVALGLGRCGQGESVIAPARFRRSEVVLPEPRRELPPGLLGVDFVRR
jgi:hypothetical protein